MFWKLDTIHYNIDLYNELKEGSLQITEVRSVDALVEATVHGIQSGALKRVGVLFTIDAEAFASPATLLKVNLVICSLWAVGLIILKPRTDKWKTQRHDGDSIPLPTYRPSPQRSTGPSRSWGRGATDSWPFTIVAW